jgi:cell envelope opacity-associated protein A
MTARSAPAREKTSRMRSIVNLKEEEEEGPVKMEAMSPEAPFKMRRVRIIRRLVERPRTVYERFPSFEKNKVLDFTELFQGFAVKKSRVVKRPLQCKRP